jgi:hypothetical protein
LKTIADTHEGKRLTVWFQDEARIGQKGCMRHRWYRRGERPRHREAMLRIDAWPTTASP